MVESLINLSIVGLVDIIAFIYIWKYYKLKDRIERLEKCVLSNQGVKNG